MSFELGSGRLRITDAAGNVKTDTDDGMLNIAGRLSGSQFIPALTVGSNTDFDLTDDYFLGTCPIDCTDVIGSVKFTLGSQIAGMPYDRWMTVMGGAALWIMDGVSLSSNFSANYGCFQMVWYFFRIDAGNVYLRRRVYASRNTGGVYTILSHTINYKLKLGLFT